MAKIVQNRNLVALLTAGLMTISPLQAGSPLAILSAETLLVTTKNQLQAPPAAGWVITQLGTGQVYDPIHSGGAGLTANRAYLLQRSLFPKQPIGESLMAIFGGKSSFNFPSQQVLSGSDSNIGWAVKKLLGGLPVVSGDAVNVDTLRTVLQNDPGRLALLQAMTGVQDIDSNPAAYQVAYQRLAYSFGDLTDMSGNPIFPQLTESTPPDFIPAIPENLFFGDW